MPAISDDLTGFQGLAESVGFRPMPAPQLEFANMDGLEFWRSPFAILALTKVEENSLRSLNQAFAESSDIIGRIICLEQGNRRLIDGYLLLLMSEKPEEELRLGVQEAELNTSICRKHVLWPDEDGSWLSALSTVTTLGLPEVSPISTPLIEPVLPRIAKQALELLESKQAFREVAGELEEMTDQEGEANAD
jgi:hypothetical protein